MKTPTLFYYAIVLQFSLEANRINDEDLAYNKCLTWNDTEKKLILTCRLPQWSKTVKFCHEKSKTYVSCNVTSDTPSCYPINKSIYKISNGTLITLVLHESKFGKDLSGEWFCETGEDRLKTKVDLFRGIISDVWVKIRVTTIESENGKRKLHIECSSCRMPSDRYAEIWFNDKSNASVWLNSTGACIFGKNTLCLPSVCNCSETGNRFEMSHEYIQNGTNIACSMTFKDDYREGKYHLTTNATFVGAEFSVTSRKIYKTLKKPISITTPEPMFSDDDAHVTAEQTTLVFKPDEQENNAIPVLAYVILVSIGILVLIIMMFVRCFIIRSRGKKEKAEMQSSGGNNQSTEEETLINRTDPDRSIQDLIDDNESIHSDTHDRTRSRNDVFDDNTSNERKIDPTENRVLYAVNKKEITLIHGVPNNNTGRGKENIAIANNGQTRQVVENLPASRNSENEETRSLEHRLLCKICANAKIESTPFYYCLDCGFRICLNCNAHHESVPYTKNHQKIFDDERLDGYTGSSLCEHHTEERIFYYCDDHYEALCRLCSDGGHAKCKKVLIEEKAEKYIEMLRKEIGRIINIYESNITSNLSRLERKEVSKGGSLKSITDVYQNDETTMENTDRVNEKLKNSLKSLHSLKTVDFAVCNILYDEKSYTHAFILMNKLSQKLMKEIQIHVSSIESNLNSDKLNLDVTEVRNSIDQSETGFTVFKYM